MKTKFTLLFLLAIAFSGANAQQVPNQSFDNWTVSPYAPDGWSSYDAIFGFNLGHCNKDTADKVYGPASVKITSDSVPGFGAYGVLAGTVALGTGSGPNPTFPGIAFAYNPDTIFLGYKYTSPGTDTAIMTVKMTHTGTGVFTGGATTLGLPLDTSSQWALIYTTLTSFYTGTAPDTMRVQFYSSSNPQPGGGIKGSTLHVDLVLFGYVNLPTALQEVANKLNVSVYPNPASDILNVSTDANANGFRVIISDVSGKLITAGELNGQQATINLSNFANGTYIYRIADKTGNILKQDRFNVVK